MTTREGCQFPELSPGTSYGKGCRCNGCRDARAESQRRYREANRETVAERKRRYYEANPILQKTRGRGTRGRYATFRPAIATGRYTPAGDAMIASWEGTWPQLAEVLGRSVGSLSGRV